MEGTVKRLTDRGFGFLAVSGSDKDLFFHAKELANLEFNDLHESDTVVFDVVDGPKGPVAVNVTRIDEPFQGYTWAAERIPPENDIARVAISDVIEGIVQLSPDLIQHLRNHSNDVGKVDPQVFEHLVGELMASAGWHDVRLVGRNPKTHTDIFALHYFSTSDGIPVRFFVEVKRWKNRIGVEVINQVYGAMVSEREKHGWHGAIIFALGSASTTRAFNKDEYRKKGIEIKDKEDLLRWLRDYKPNGDGLYVPPEFSSHIPSTC